MNQKGIYEWHFNKSMHFEQTIKTLMQTYFYSMPFDFYIFNKNAGFLKL